MSTKHTKKQPKPKQAKRPRQISVAVPADAPQAVAAEPAPVTEAKLKRQALKPMALSDRITAVGPCPYKPGTKSAINYAKYKVGLTVKEALEAGCPRDYVAWDRRYGHLTIGPGQS